MLNIKQSDGEHVLFNEQIKDFLVITYDLYLNNKALTHIYIYIYSWPDGWTKLPEKVEII